PLADARLSVRRDVRAIEDTEWGGDRQPARVGLPATFGMTSCTVTCARQIFTSSSRGTILVVGPWFPRESQRGRRCNQRQYAERSIAFHRTRVDHRWVT